MTKPKMGRPTKEEALTRAIEALGGVGIDHELVDPRRIVAAIAADPAVPETTRLRACLILMAKQTRHYGIDRESGRRERESDEHHEYGRGAKCRDEYRRLREAGVPAEQAICGAMEFAANN